MEQKENKFLNLFIKILSYVLVAAVTCVVTVVLVLPTMKYYNSYIPLREPEGELEAGADKLEELLGLIDVGFIGDADMTAMTDAAANAIVAATGDEWSYYISAAEMDSYESQKHNSYVGIGITISTSNTAEGFPIDQVEPGGSAQKAGIMPGDILVEAQGEDLRGAQATRASELIRGEEGTQVTVSVMRGQEKLTFTMKRMQITQKVAKGQLLQGDVGYIRIANFNDRCAAETIALIEELTEQGATSLLFDVRFNGGGYKAELVRVLDYLLPAGDLFTSVDYTGTKEVDTSNPDCLEMPMAVLMNQYSYSAAEFFAAALEEYDWAFTVGQRTVGKGYFQITVPLADGSAVALSVGKYYTPKGVSLAETGGLVPTVEVPVDEDTEALIYSELLELDQDPQIQAAIAKLKGN